MVDLLPIWERAILGHMRVIALRTLRAFWEQHPDAEPALQAWYHDVKQAAWRTPADIKSVYRNASFVRKQSRGLQREGSTTIRLRASAVQYQLGIVYIRFVGTHQDYDRVNAATV